MVAATPGADVAQLSSWATVRRHAGFRSIFLMAEDTAGLIGGALVLHRRLPVIGSVGYLPYGPVLPDGASRDAAGIAMCAALAGLTDRGLRALFVQPPRGGEPLWTYLAAWRDFVQGQPADRSVLSGWTADR